MVGSFHIGPLFNFHLPRAFKTRFAVDNPLARAVPQVFMVTISDFPKEFEDWRL
jgi:hypothetical protein